MNFHWQIDIPHLQRYACAARTTLPFTEALCSCPLGPQDCIVPPVYFGLARSGQEGLYATQVLPEKGSAPSALQIHEAKEKARVKKQARKLRHLQRAAGRLYGATAAILLFTLTYLGCIVGASGRGKKKIEERKAAKSA